jgi:hypothetical protein
MVGYYLLGPQRKVQAAPFDTTRNTTQKANSSSKKNLTRNRGPPHSGEGYSIYEIQLRRQSI